MARTPMADRPHNREVENENLRVPQRSGEPPRPATEPPGSAWSQRSDETVTDPGSGETRKDQKQRGAPEADPASHQPTVPAPVAPADPAAGDGQPD